ncbi:MAG: hypothetical protein ABJ275_03855 [Maricaulaceae bacterium]
MKFNINTIARLALIALAGLGTFGGLSLTAQHIKHGEVCPMIASVPACIIVFLGYLCVLLAAIFIKNSFAKRLFYIGWTPVFLLALMGVLIEVGVMLGIVKDHICPIGAYNIPQCFFSFAMVLICLVLYKLALKAAKPS